MICYFCSRRGRGVFRLLGAVPSATARGHLRGREPRRPLEHFENRRERLPSVDLRVGYSVLPVGHHKPAVIQPHVVQVQGCVQSESLVNK